jgi:hypothetical protein
MQTHTKILFSLLELSCAQVLYLEVRTRTTRDDPTERGRATALDLEFVHFRVFARKRARERRSTRWNALTRAPRALAR